MALVFARDAFVHMDGNRLSDHARSEVEQTPERLGNSVRTARGKLKKTHIADKMTFSMSWERLPETDAKTVDGFWGAKSIIDFYRATPGEFTFSLVQADGTPETYTVVFEDFSYSIVARYGEYYYDIDLSVTEV